MEYMNYYGSYNKFCKNNNVISWRVVPDNSYENCSSYPEDHYFYYARVASGEEIFVDILDSNMRRYVYSKYKS